MRWFLLGVAVCLPLVLFAGTGRAQKFAPPNTHVPDEETLKKIAEKAKQLEKDIASLRTQGIPDAILADVEVFHRAAESIVKLKEFYHKDSAAWTLEVLDRGLIRARVLRGGQMPWIAAGRTVARGYRSRIDGTLQPVAITYPANYGQNPKKVWRVDVVLHGRHPSLTEVQFLHSHNETRPVPAEQDYVTIEVYGRGNNAYRWAGETDVFEALEFFFAAERSEGRGRLLNARKLVLRGFSMGGAGTWHIGLHFPAHWAVIGPGAGFTTTRGYAKLPASLPSYQEACLHIYDAVDYAENAFNVPIVAYSGGKDPQKAAADLIEKRLGQLGLQARMTHLIAPDQPHRFPPEWFKKANALWSKYTSRRSQDYPEKIHFVTYTLKYPSCAWLEILGLDKHYVKAEVQADHLEDGFKVKTANVRILHLRMPEGVTEPQKLRIDDQDVQARPVEMPDGLHHVYLRKLNGRWRTALPERLNTYKNQKPQKVPRLQGPIDDAFCEPFLCVRGTGKPWHAATQKWADAKLEQFRADWAKHWRGELRIINDVDVTRAQIASNNLILFGDPSSNSIIGDVLDALPLRWTKDEIDFAGKKVAAAGHLPVLIYPCPLNANRYIVLNTGPTIPSADYVKTNALLYPRLGDFALLRVNPNAADAAGYETVAAGLFNEFWQIP